MKRLFAFIALCALGTALYAVVKPKTKYICSLGSSGSIYTTEFETREECESTCFQGGVPAVCEETAEDTKIDEIDVDFS